MAPVSTIWVVISTDGSTLNNGDEDAAAGFGIYFGDDDPRNAGLPCGDGPQTNNRAELMAILEALRRVDLHVHVRIRTDSKLSKDMLEGGYRNQRIRSFKQPQGYVITNEKVIQDINEVVRQRNAFKAKTIYTWVRGHAGDVGNEAADKLAKKGARAQLAHFWKMHPWDRGIAETRREKKKANYRARKKLKARIEALRNGGPKHGAEIGAKGKAQSSGSTQTTHSVASAPFPSTTSAPTTSAPTTSPYNTHPPDAGISSSAPIVLS